MRLRCPNHDCPLDLPEDLAGTHIRCPHCGEMMLVERPESATAVEQIQAELPDMLTSVCGTSRATLLVHTLRKICRQSPRLVQWYEEMFT